jgi:hypothetical protein
LIFNRSGSILSPQWLGKPEGKAVKANEKKCPRCAEIIKKDAVVCKHCGHQFSASEIEAEKKAQAKATKNGAVGCFGVLGLLLIIGMCSAGGKEDAASNSTTVEAQALTAEQQKALEVSNKKLIDAKLKEIKTLPESDAEGNAKAYGELVTLAPANSSYIEKRDRYAGIVAEAATYAENPEKALELVKLTWEKGGFDNVQLVHFTVKNNAPFAIKDFTLECNHQGPSGTDMDSNTRVVYELVPANGQKRVREVNMGLIAAQATTSRCEITNAVRA